MRKGFELRNVNWTSILRWTLAAFFAFGGVGNIFASESILADYQRWGYPDWFHYLTGSLEVLVAGLLLIWPRRPQGAMLGGGVMFAAAATVIANGEYSHSIAPLLVFSLCMLLVILIIRTGRDRYVK